MKKNRFFGKSTLSIFDPKDNGFFRQRIVFKLIYGLSEYVCFILENPGYSPERIDVNCFQVKFDSSGKQVFILKTQINFRVSALNFLTLVCVQFSQRNALKSLFLFPPLSFFLPRNVCSIK